MGFIWIIGFLIFGIIISYFNLIPRKWLLKSKYISSTGLIFLLLAMGIKIGANPNIINSLGRIGFQALILSLFAIIGSILFLSLFSNKIDFMDNITLSEENPELSEDSGKIRLDFIIVLPVLFGFAAGYFLIPSHFLNFIDNLTTYALWILLLGVGLDLGLNKVLLKEVKNYGPQIFLIPFLIAAGSIVGAVTAGLILGLSANTAAAVGSGFGWYSLSGIIITNMGFTEIGSLAFLTNIFREILTLLTLPYLARYFQKIITIAPGGATTMDVTLPVIKKVAGNKMVIPAFISGIILSGLVPILVPLFMNI